MSFDIPSYIFGGDTGVKTPQELERKRALVDSLLAQQAGSASPKNFGEGLSALGKALMTRQARQSLNTDEASVQSGQDALSPIITAALAGQGISPSSPAVPASPQTGAATMLGQTQPPMPTTIQAQPIQGGTMSGPAGASPFPTAGAMQNIAQPQQQGIEQIGEPSPQPQGTPVGPIDPTTGQSLQPTNNLPPALSGGQSMPVPQAAPQQVPQGAASGQLAALMSVANDPRFPFASPAKQKMVYDQIQAIQSQSTPLAQLQLQAAQAGLTKDQMAIKAAQDQTAAKEDYIKTLDPADAALWRADPEAAAKILTQKAKNGGEGEFFGTPVYLRNDDGSVSIALPNKSGGLKVLDTQGHQVVGPFEKSLDTNRGKAVGEQVGAAQAALPGQISDVQTTNMQIDSLLKSPDLKDAVGYSSWKPDWMVGNGVIDVRSRVKQLMGTSFLQSRQMLKGGGAITDYEGGKADAAYSRMEQAIRSGNPQDFQQALVDFRDNVNRGLAKLQNQAGMASDNRGGVTSPGIPGNTNIAPPQGGVIQYDAQGNRVQ